MSQSDRRALCDEVFAKISGKVAELANNHKGSWVVQAVLKHGTPEQSAKIMREVKPQMALLAKSLYGNFLVRKLIDSTDKKEVSTLVNALKGKLRDWRGIPSGRKSWRRCITRRRRRIRKR